MRCKCGAFMDELPSAKIERWDEVTEMLCETCGRKYRRVGESESWSAPTKILNGEVTPRKPSNILVEG